MGICANRELRCPLCGGTLCVQGDQWTGPTDEYRCSKSGKEGHIQLWELATAGKNAQGALNELKNVIEWKFDLGTNGRSIDWKGVARSILEITKGESNEE